MDMISGTNGISGATDTNFVLMKTSRSKSTATLYCTGRDIEYRELNLEFDSETHFWNLLSDNSTLPPLPAVSPPVGRFVASKGGSGVRIPPGPFGSMLGRFSACREQSRRKGWGRARPHPGHFCPTRWPMCWRGTLGVFANRMGKLLFNLTVEHNITNHLLAADVDMTRDEYNELRSGSVHEVNSTRGAISLKDVIQEGND